MSHSLSLFVANYGYLAIFTLLVIQELGIPVPAPNELLLMFFGFLAFQGSLHLPLTMIVTIVASMAGAWILYGAFYGFGSWIMNYPKIPFPRALIHSLSEKINRRSWFAVFIGRIVPFGRGYICVAAGLVKIHPEKFAFATVAADTIWNGGFVLAGFFSGPYWDKVAVKVGGIEHLFLLIILAFFLILGISFLIKKIKKDRV